MKCFFLRHGIAVDAEDWKGAEFDRPLTREGRERLERSAKTIAALGLNLDAMLTSPLVRARDTAAIVAGRLKLRDGPIEDGRLDTAFDADRLAEILTERAGATAIMLVGHEPSMSQTIGHITGARIDFKKGALAYVDVAEPASSLQGTLVWLVPPKVLAL